MTRGLTYSIDMRPGPDGKRSGFPDEAQLTIEVIDDGGERELSAAYVRFGPIRSEGCITSKSFDDDAIVLDFDSSRAIVGLEVLCYQSRAECPEFLVFVDQRVKRVEKLFVLSAMEFLGMHWRTLENALCKPTDWGQLKRKVARSVKAKHEQQWAPLRWVG